MKAVLVGTDLMYRKDGKLVPIEINTNVGWDEKNRVESEENIWQLEALAAYVKEHNIKELEFLPGIAQKILDNSEKIQELFAGVTIKVNCSRYIADSDSRLIIRSDYSAEALVDAWCRDKIAFLQSLEGTDLAIEYLLKTSEGLSGNISSVETEYPEDIPNFIMKYRYPQYDKNVYPKLYRFTSREDLVSFAESMPEDFFLMPYYFCKDKLFNKNRIQLVREWSLFIVNAEGSVDSVELGRYTKVCGPLTSKVKYEDIGELKEGYRSQFLTTGWIDRMDDDNCTVLDSCDLVWMSDGSWKVAKNLKKGDIVKSLDIPVQEGYSSTNHEGNYGTLVENLKEEATYVDNKIIGLVKVAEFADIVKFVFTDGTDWYDTADSSYPTVSSINTVEFKKLSNIKAGDQVILISTENDTPTFIEKEVESVSRERKLLDSGYRVSVNGSHLFISKTSEDQQAYAAIEHNVSGPCSEYLWIKYPAGNMPASDTSNIKVEYPSIFSQQYYNPSYRPKFNSEISTSLGDAVTLLNNSYFWDTGFTRLNVKLAQWTGTRYDVTESLTTITTFTIDQNPGFDRYSCKAATVANAVVEHSSSVLSEGTASIASIVANSRVDAITADNQGYGLYTLEGEPLQDLGKTSGCIVQFDRRIDPYQKKIS